MHDDGGKIGVADLVEGIAFGKGVRLYLEVVVIRDALDRRFWIVAAVTVLIVQTPTESLLIAQSNLFELEFDFLVRLVVASMR